jgi:cytidylate kinase
VSFRAVCISRLEGAGGAQVGRHVAERLGFAYVDEEIVARAAAKGRVSAEDVADEERRKSALRRLLEEIGRGSGAESIGLADTSAPTLAGVAPDEIRALIVDAIEETAARGEVVIVSHAASHALAGRREVLRVLVTASPATRVKRLRGERGLEPKEAEKLVKAADAARSDYLRRFYEIESELPTHYDLVVNTDMLGSEHAAELVATAAAWHIE